MNGDQAMNKISDSRESICALVDGQLHGEAFAQAVERVQCDDDARATWLAYHVVGDVLRSDDVAQCRLGGDFVSRLQARLQTEAPLVSAKPSSNVLTQPVVMPELLNRAAANESLFRWKLVAGLASVAAVVAVGWTLTNTLPPASSSGPTLALAASPAGATHPQAPDSLSQVMIRDPQLDAMLAAHKQFGGSTSALQTSTGFLRSATFEVPAR